MKYTYQVLVTLIIILISINIIGCKEATNIEKQKMDNYQYKQITIKNITEEGDKLKIEYSTLLETLYFCPGVKLEEQGNKIFLIFIRCSIKKNCDIDIKAERNTSGKETLILDNNGKNIFIKDISGQYKIHPR
jgi:hypothetical protein